MSGKYLSNNFLILGFSSLLIGCGGSGGASNPIKSFSNWNAITYPSKVIVDGVAYEGGYTDSADGSIVTSVTTRQIASTPVIALQYNESGALQTATVSTATARVDLSQYGYPYREFIQGTHANGDFAVFLNPSTLGWLYQTAGVYDDDSLGRFGAMSAGSDTAGADIPTSGSATFSGLWQAIYLPAVETER